MTSCDSDRQYLSYSEMYYLLIKNFCMTAKFKVRKFFLECVSMYTANGNVYCFIKLTICMYSQRAICANNVESTRIRLLGITLHAICLQSQVNQCRCR